MLSTKYQAHRRRRWLSGALWPGCRFTEDRGCLNPSIKNLLSWSKSIFAYYPSSESYLAPITLIAVCLQKRRPEYTGRYIVFSNVNGAYHLLCTYGQKRYGVILRNHELPWLNYAGLVPNLCGTTIGADFLKIMWPAFEILTNCIHTKSSMSDPVLPLEPWGRRQLRYPLCEYSRSPVVTEVSHDHMCCTHCSVPLI